MNQQNTKGSLSGQEVVVLVYFGEQAWFESVFSNMACDFDIMVEVNLNQGDHSFLKNNSQDISRKFQDIWDIFPGHFLLEQIR